MPLEQLEICSDVQMPVPVLPIRAFYWRPAKAPYVRNFFCQNYFRCIARYTVTLYSVRNRSKKLGARGPGAEPPAGVEGAEPLVGVRGQSPLKPKHFCKC